MSAYDDMIAAAAAAYGADSGVLKGIAKYESGFNPKAKNNWDSNAKAGYPSEGIVQYIPSTFESHKNAAIKANRAAWQGVSRDFRDPQAQLLAAAWGLANGKGKAWTTFDRAQKYKGTGPKGGSITPAIQPLAPAAPGATSGPDPVLSNIFAKRGMNPLVAQLLAEEGAQQVQPAASAIDAAASTGDGSALVATAESQVGKIAAEAAAFLKKNNIPMTNRAWCGQFVQALFKANGLKPPPAAYVPTLLEWGKKQGKITKTPRPGDMAVFQWDSGPVDHIEVVKSYNNGKLITIGGNTGGSRSGSQVAEKNRTGTNVQFVRSF